MILYLKFILIVIIYILCATNAFKQVNATAINRIESSDYNVNDLEEANYFCPHSCNCSDHKYVKCAHAKLKEVPQDLPKGAMIIDLSFNHIRELYPGDFTNSVNAIEIILNGNKLEKLEKNVFAGLTYLERLRITHNKLTSLAPDVFSLAINLKLLDLSHNSVLVPKTGPFLIQPSLRDFYCTKCNLKNIYNATFENLSSLTTLELGKNKLNSKNKIEGFLPLQNLKTLEVDKFERNLTKDLCFELTSLETISFEYFNFSCLKLIAGKMLHECVSSKNTNKEKRNKIDWLETVEDENANANGTIISVVGISSDKGINDEETDKAIYGSIIIYIIVMVSIIGLITIGFLRKVYNSVSQGNQLLAWLRRQCGEEDLANNIHNRVRSTYLAGFLRIIT